MPLNSPLASLGETRDFLAARNLFPRKNLGQNFLIDDHVIGHILSLAQIEQHDSVLEVGPGIGVLTLALIEAGAQVTAVELDPNLAAELPKTVAFYEGEQALNQLAIIEADATKLDATLLPNCPSKLVANLPYNVAATTVLHLFETFPALKSATVMVQTEVAWRMAAKPGVKDYGAYTIKLGCYAQPVDSFVVSPSCFMPPPRVSSTVIKLNRISTDEDPVFIKQAARVIDAAFAQRRKTIRNSMSATLVTDKNLLDAAFSACNLDSSRRAETYLKEDFFALTRALISAGFVL